MVRRVLLGEYIEQVDVRNTTLVYGEADVMGISTTKSFISTKADLSNVSLASYKIVDVNQFAYVADTSRRGDKIGLAFQDKNPCLISSIYTTFRVKDEKQLDPYYLMMFFKRPEFDRYARFHSWGSARETFTWEDMCNIEIPLPEIEVQREYVAVYKAMQHNLQTMQTKLDDLKLVCDGYIENLRKQYPSERIGEYITEVDERNTDRNVLLVQGVDATGSFCETKADMTGIDICKYKVVRQGSFAYNPSRINIGSISINLGEDCIVSPMYQVFKVVDENKLSSRYLQMWLSRKEFFRSTLFYAVGSVRDTFDLTLMCEVRIPIPPIDVQRSIVAIYDVYNKRKQYAERMRQQINEVCPVLVAMTSSTPPKEGLSK